MSDVILQETGVSMIETECGVIDGLTLVDCPFCGEADAFTAFLDIVETDEGMAGQISCGQCLSYGPAVAGDLRALVDAWNTRWQRDKSFTRLEQA